MRANPLLLHQVEEHWPRPWWLVSIDDQKWIALLLPPETRRVGREAFLAPREVRRQLQEVFMEGYYEETEVEKVDDRYVERVKAIYVSDNYASYEVHCPFCGEPQRIETLNELRYEGECPRCGALIYFEWSDELLDAVMELLEEYEKPEITKREGWTYYRFRGGREAASREVYRCGEMRLHIIFIKWGERK